MNTRATKRQKTIPFQDKSIDTACLRRQEKCDEWVDSCQPSDNPNTLRGHICIWHRTTRLDRTSCYSCDTKIEHAQKICDYCSAVYCGFCFEELRKQYGIARHGGSKFIRSHWSNLRNTIFSGLNYCPLCKDDIQCLICQRYYVLQVRGIKGFGRVCSPCESVFESTKAYLYRLLEQFPIGRDVKQLIHSFVYP